jgi:hypothetical protein
MLQCQCQSSGHLHKPNECLNQGYSEKENLCDTCYFQVLNERAPAFANPNSSLQSSLVHINAVLSWWGGPWPNHSIPPPPPKLPEEHPFYTLVGRVASEWAHLEHILDATIWNLLDIDPKFAACVTSQIMGIGPRCKVIITLCSVRTLSEDLKKSYRRLMNESYLPADWRARFVHDPWFTETPDIAKQFRAMPYVDQRFGEQDIDKTTIQQLLSQIKALQSRASELRNQVSSALETLPKMNALPQP